MQEFGPRSSRDRIVSVEQLCDPPPPPPALPSLFLLGTRSADISSITGLNWGRAWLKPTKDYIDL